MAHFFFEDSLALGRSKPKKILMSADTVGGVWTFALELARALGRQGVHVALATMGQPLTREQCDDAAEVPTLEIYESNFKLEWMLDAWKEVDLAGTWLLELEESLQPDIVHLNGYAHAPLPWHAPTVVVGHSCMLSWWLAVRGEPAPDMWSTYRQRVTRGLRSAGAVIAPSRSMLATLNQHYGPLHVRVIPNGRDPHYFMPGEKEPLVFSLGRVWDEAKNIGALQRIAPELSWAVTVAGEQKHPEGGELATENVCFLGAIPIPALADWLSRAAIFAMPARYEPFGLSILEAGLSGCALVLGDISSLRENWEDAAVFIPPGDSEFLRQAIEDLIADDERREALGMTARARAVQFTPERMAAAYLEVYSDLMAANNLMIKN